MKKSRLKFPDAKIAFCDKHREPFKATLPKGYLLAATDVLNTVMQDMRFMSRFPKDAKGKYVLDEEKATKILHEISPLCCWIGEEKMGRITESATGCAVAEKLMKGDNK